MALEYGAVKLLCNWELSLVLQLCYEALEKALKSQQYFDLNIYCLMARVQRLEDNFRCPSFSPSSALQFETRSLIGPGLTKQPLYLPNIGITGSHHQTSFCFFFKHGF